MQEVEDGKTVYELELKVQGRTRDVTMDGAGRILKVEEEIPLAPLPPAVKSTIEKQAGSGKILLVESVKELGKIAFYEAHVQAGDKEIEIKVAPDGKVIPEAQQR